MIYNNLIIQSITWAVCFAVLRVQADVAGATFMAVGSSAPELCTSIIGLSEEERPE